MAIAQLLYIGHEAESNLYTINNLHTYNIIYIQSQKYIYIYLENIYRHYY